MNKALIAKVLMTIAEYARHRGCSEKAVRKAIAEGRITRIGTGRRCIDPEVADIQWAKNTRARADSARPAASSVPTEGDETAAAEKAPSGADTAEQGAAKSAYTDHRAQVEAETLRKVRRENAQAEGLLIERKRVDRAVFDAFRALRDRAMAVGQRAAPKCIGLADPRDIERVIDDEQRRAFADWESDMRRRLPHPDGYPAEEAGA